MLKRHLCYSFILSVLIIPTIAFSQLPSWATKQLQLRNLLDQCIAETQKWQQKDGGIFGYLNQYKWDDEVEIFYGWTIYYLYTGDESVYQSVKGAAFKYIERAGGSFVHGYYPNPFFDTEHTLEGLNMLGALAFVRPTDQEVITALVDLVEHVGNWVPGYAPWFDYNTKHIKSLKPGTQRVDQGCNSGIDWPFNLGFAKLALAAYHATEDQRYLDWVGTYLDGWIESMERNERENGYYVLPAEVDPITGELGPCSGVWWYAGFEPGWGWQEKGNNANRDMRGAFLDYYKITKNEKYLDALKKHLWTLFNNGSGSIPAHYFDGTSWSAYSDKVTARMAVDASLLSPDPDPAFDAYLDRWTFHQEDYQMWDFRHNENWGAMDAILNEAIKDVNSTLSKLKNLQSLPSQPDHFPEIREIWGISLSAFGGVLANRGEMPRNEALYFRGDGSLGLEPGVAALVAKGNDSAKVVYLANSNSSNKIVELQADFRPSNLVNVLVNDAPHNDYSMTRARVNVPAGGTVKVELIISGQDTIPPLPVSNQRIVSVSENNTHIAWDAPPRAEDGDLPRRYRIYRDGVELAIVDSLGFIDTKLAEQHTYVYTVNSLDDAGNVSDPVSLTVTTAADMTPPAITAVTAINETLLHIQFSEPLDAASATYEGNYTILPSVNVRNVQLNNDRIVMLETSPHQQGVTYSLMVSGVKDASRTGNEINMSSPIAYTYSPELKVTSISRRGYFMSKRAVGDSVYIDRDYQITEIPAELAGLWWLVTANDDKTIVADSFLTFSINRPASIYIGVDQRLVNSNAIPGWLDAWKKSDKIISTTDASYVCFNGQFGAGQITLGGNGGSNSSSMYLVLFDSSVDVLAPSPPTGLQISKR